MDPATALKFNLEYKFPFLQPSQATAQKRSLFLQPSQAMKVQRKLQFLHPRQHFNNQVFLQQHPRLVGTMSLDIGMPFYLKDGTTEILLVRHQFQRLLFRRGQVTSI